MKRITLIFLSIFFILSVQAQSPKKFYKNAKKLVETQEYDAALNELNQAITLDSRYMDAFILRADVYEKKKDLELAKADYETTCYLDSKSADNAYNAGRLNYLTGNYTKAGKYLNDAVILDPEHFRALQYKSFNHIKNAEFKEAVVSINNAMKIKQSYIGFYVRGVANDSLTNYALAISDYKRAIGMNADYSKGFYALSKAYLKYNQLDNALNNSERTVNKFPEDYEGYLVRSMVYRQRGELALAINDLTKVLTMKGDDYSVVFTRGIYYFEFNQFQNAKADFAQVLTNDPSNIGAIYWRARSSEELMENDKAIADFEMFERAYLAQKKPSEYAADATRRLFELKRENISPELVIDTPMVISESNLAILKDQTRLQIQGKLKDDAAISTFKINDETIELAEDNTFTYSLNITDINTVQFVANDAYGNEMDMVFDLLKMETSAPVAHITTPYAGDNGEIYLDSNDENLFVEGYIEDESLIKEVFLNGVRASFNDTELNPRFTATIDVFNKSTLEVKAVDNFGNELLTTFTLNREGALIAENNPMGKTWVIFIENSNYDTFASLEGPTKDVSTIKAALSQYEVHNFIHKKDMSKKDMERFFAIELRDQVKKNNVNSLMVWYAGHGKFISETGYWIPTDATRDDEFTYFNINSLKAGMQSYSNIITHTLVITDACESGPSFYQAMRATNEKRSCDDVNATKFKSSQVFSSAGYELASDNSQFTKTFAKSLQFNENACIPIETIVVQVTEAVSANVSQKPQFGKIAGLEDENGTFFFIKK